MLPISFRFPVCSCVFKTFDVGNVVEDQEKSPNFSKERKTKNHLKQSCMWSELQALKVGWLTQSKTSCHGQTLINECSIFDYPSHFEGL